MTCSTRGRTAAVTAATVAATLAVTATATGLSAGTTGAAQGDTSTAASAVESAVLGRYGLQPWLAAVGVSVRTTMTDLDDTEGRLDVRSVHHRLAQLRPHHVRVTYQIQTFGRFRDGLLSSPDREIVLELHRTATRGADRNVTISSESGVLTATVISNATRKPIARARAVRLDARTVRVVGSRQLIGARSYFVTANFHQGGSPHCGWRDGWPVTCQDSVPDSGWITVDRMGWPDSA